MAVVHRMAGSNISSASDAWVDVISLAAQDHIANPTGANIITNFGFGN